MSTPVTYVGNQYNIPAHQDTGYAQGTGNLSSYLIALATGSLTLSGGSFPLTADADFGASFGLKSIYYKSRAATLASSGILRTGNNEVIFASRNAGNTADVTAKINTSDQLEFSTGMNFKFTSPDGTKTAVVGLDNDGNFGVIA